ncbi:MAG: hypothetical protein H0U03_07395 [Actinobacteria bacterium]|nr:hypothetical protein [Actinomycetota bacterium]
MPSKKQRRRQKKSRRHEYEYVYVDEEGREVDVEQVEADRPRKDGSAKPRAAASRGRPARTIEPPSWRRSIRRGLIFAPIMFATMWLIARDLSIAQRLFQTAYLLVMFVPFTYFFDRFMYRRFVKQGGVTPSGAPRRR